MAVGIHIIADLYGVDSKLIERAEKMMNIIEEAVKFTNLTKVSSDYYQFEPFGASGVVLIAESHLSFHTWPEHGLVTIDIYTCGAPEKAERAYKYILEKLKPERVEVVVVERGKEIQQDKESNTKNTK